MVGIAALHPPYMPHALINREAGVSKANHGGHRATEITEQGNVWLSVIALLRASVGSVKDWLGYSREHHRAVAVDDDASFQVPADRAGEDLPFDISA